MLILASASPRRRALLARLCGEFRVVASEVEERLGPGPLAEAVVRLAERKARAVAAAEPGAVVLGADTVVALPGEVLGKPADADEARRMLRRLRGRWHEVLTGVAVVGPRSDQAEGRCVRSEVLMRAFDDPALERYVATGEPLDKAGAYAVQGQGGALVAAVVGSWSNVVGLPLCETRRLLASLGVPLRPGGAP